MCVVSVRGEMIICARWWSSCIRSSGLTDDATADDATEDADVPAMETKNLNSVPCMECNRVTVCEENL